MTIDNAKDFFLYCTLVNYAILIVWSIGFRVWHDEHYSLTRAWFPSISREQYDLINCGAIAIYKAGVLFLNLVPYIALRMLGH